ncbi:hypothetical protein BIW11_09283 [Tropilaelaps mercedesae]|uniref:Polyadenylate-binding protein-interacting protein 1-like n=1 Tax=Tropilaelaps mercedesae TaxID=418985 RepID=A0A1V9XL15_9ACAR|nr:hypothetical protein BIW11_09283 [Tropilaelaps mercedesae]
MDNNNHQRTGGSSRNTTELNYHNGTGRCYHNQSASGNSLQPSYYHSGSRHDQSQGGNDIDGGSDVPIHLQASSCSPQGGSGPQYSPQQQNNQHQRHQQHPSHHQGGISSTPSTYQYISATPPCIRAAFNQLAQGRMSQHQQHQTPHNVHHSGKQHPIQHPSQPLQESQNSAGHSVHRSINRHHTNHLQQPQQQLPHSIVVKPQHENNHHARAQLSFSGKGNVAGGFTSVHQHQHLQNQQQHRQDTSRPRSQQHQPATTNSPPSTIASVDTSIGVMDTAGVDFCAAGTTGTAMPSGSGYTLSPTAQEFVPASFLATQDRHFTAALSDVSPGSSIGEIQQHSQVIPHSIARGRDIGAGGRHQSFGGQHDPYDDSYGSSYGLSNSYDEEEDALLQLQMFITDVTLSPAMFEARVYDLAEVIYEELKRNPATTPHIVATIFQAGVLQQNFRYSGARLCDYLSELVVVQGQHLIRNQIIEHTYKAVSSSRTVFGDRERDKESRGMVLFCAELLSQLDLGYGLTLASYPDMGPKLVGIISELIRSSEKDNQKNAIQALKLCGGNLEKLCEGFPLMDVLLAECGAVEAREGIDATIKAMLQRLPQLRQHNWGYVAKARKEPSAYAYGQHAQVDYSQLPIMYGPDGLPLSTEEMGFLDGGNTVTAGDYPSDPSQGNSAGMDDEALEAYEQFLQETGQK